MRKFTEHRRVHVRFRALTLALACGLSLAAGFGARDARAEDKPVPPVESAIGGRWVGSPHVLGADRNRCDGTACKLTLDIVKCGEGWCGIEVAKDGACLTTALRLGTGTIDFWRASFQGKLELAQFTEPYMVEASLSVKPDGGHAPVLAIYGNTGPELMLFRRTFPFHMHMERTADATCKYEQKTS